MFGPYAALKLCELSEGVVLLLLLPQKLRTLLR
jgi:hypothetical protein